MRDTVIQIFVKIDQSTCNQEMFNSASLYTEKVLINKLLEFEKKKRDLKRNEQLSFHRTSEDRYCEDDVAYLHKKKYQI